MDFAGFSVRPEEVIAGLKSLSNYLNRDKNAICLGLIIINKNIIDWYREIVNIIDDEIAKNLLQPGKNLTLKDARRILTFIDQNSREDTAAHSLLFLQDIVNRYNNNQLRKLVGKLDVNRIIKIEYLIAGRKEGDRNFKVDKMDIDQVRNVLIRKQGRGLLSDEIPSFIPKVESETGLFTYVEMMNKYGDLNRAEKLRRWLKELEAIKNEIRDNISIVLHELDCKQQSIEALRQEVLKNGSKAQE